LSLLKDRKKKFLSENTLVYIPPMAGVTDIAYRTLCRELDENVVLATEMLSSKSLTYAHLNKKDHHHSKRLTIPEGDKLTGVQIFGHEPDVMAEATKIATGLGANFIDINMGCPVAKIVNGMDGAALMKEPELACEIVAKVKASTHLPVTVKTRLGWCEETLNAPFLAKEFQKLGIEAITIHGRTRAQKYQGEAKWSLIKEVVDAVDIPVFANGDVKTLDDAKSVYEETGAYGIAIARATMGKPWFSKQVSHFIETGEILDEPPLEKKLELALKHCQLLVEHKGELVGIRESRRHINNYISGMPGASKLRSRINQINSIDDAKREIDLIFENNRVIASDNEAI
jgi:tRNA-dihydrouridine synthase B